MRNINFAFSYFTAALCALIFAILFLIYLSTPQILNSQVTPQYHMYKSLPDSSQAITQIIEIKKDDGRGKIIENFFKARRSPLADFASDFIDTADKYNLDFRLLPAIAMHESNGGKTMPKNSFNPFGYGIYGGKVLRFKSFTEAIDRVGRGLKDDYLNKGLKTPEEIMAKYTPPSLQKGGAWAMGVSAFMAALN